MNIHSADPKGAFIQRLVFAGTILKGKEKVDNLHVEIEFSRIKPKSITGRIRGNKDTFEKLLKLSKSEGIFYSLTAAKKFRMGSNEKKRVMIQKCFVHLHAWDLEPDFESLISWDVATLQIYDLKIVTEYPDHEPNERSITYYLCGPRLGWPTYFGRRQFNPDGSVLIHKNLDSNKCLVAEYEGVSVNAITRFEFEYYSPSQYQDIIANVLALQLTTINLEMEDLEFLRRTTSLVDDLLLLYSFATRRWSNWYCCKTALAGKTIEFYRPTRLTTDDELNFDKMLIALEDMNEFFSLALRNYRNRRDNGQDLTQALIYSIAGWNHDTIEPNLASFFYGLELVCHVMLEEIANKRVLEDKRFDCLREKLTDTINEFDLADEAKTELISRLGNLKMSSFNFRFSQLLRSLDVNIDDLSANDGKPLDFIRTRNRLFHLKGRVSVNELLFSKENAGAVLERILLKSLGWNKYDATHDQSFVSYMKERPNGVPVDTDPWSEWAEF